MTKQLFSFVFQLLLFELTKFYHLPFFSCQSASKTNASSFGTTTATAATPVTMSSTKPIKRSLHALVPVSQLAFVIGTLFFEKNFVFL